MAPGRPDSRLARLRRRLRARLRRPRAHLVYSGHYGVSLARGMLDARRGERILAFLFAQGLLGRGQLHRPRRVSMGTLRRVHSDRYLESLQTPGAATPIVGQELGDARLDEFLEAQRDMVGGTVLALRRALAGGGVAINLGGGLHHARADFGQGFCAFNDIAVAVAVGRAEGFQAPVLVIDLDLHDGEGTRAIFAEDESVHTFSIHNRHLGPTGVRASTSIELGDDVDDTRYREVLERHLPGLLHSVRPGLVVYVAGCDPAADDVLGNWRISPEGLLQRDRYVVGLVRGGPSRPPLVILPGGGYGGNAWRYSGRFLAWLLCGEAVEPPDTAEQTLTGFRRIARGLDVAQLTAERTGGSWSLAEEDVMPTRRPSRLLDFYSRHGVELALERYGLLEQLRSRGFERLRLEVDLGDPAGQTVRVLSDADKPLRLIEVRLRRDTRTIPGMELLFVEWLLLQNPSATFTRERPALPGQQHPGLGLLREITSLLVLMCERLGLDGLCFVPTHYHIAAQAGDYFHFLEPEDEGRFHAARAALAGQSLGRAVRRLSAGRLVRATTREPFEWQPAPMMLPVSARLKALLEDPAHRELVAQARNRWKLVPLGGA